MFKRNNIRTVALALLLSCGISTTVDAGTVSTNLSVSVTIAANCTMTTSAVAFGTYDPIVANASASLDGSGTITTACTNGTGYVITLGQGSNANTGSTDTAPLRRMGASTNRLNYALYQNSGRTTVWGNTAGTAPSSINGTGLSVNVTVYGSIPAGQNLPTGSYTDTVVATVTF